MIVAKRLIFSDGLKELFGEVVRIATPEDKLNVLGLTTDEVYLLVDFTYGKVDYRGLWQQDACLIVDN